MCDTTYDSCAIKCAVQIYRSDSPFEYKNTKLYHLQTSNVMKEATFKNSASS